MATLIIILLILFLPAPILAQGYLRMERLTTEQGLSQNMVFKIFHDREGFLWFCTRDGLNRYDGNKFMVFRHKALDSTSLPWTSVRCIAQDARGDIWLSSYGGLCRLDRRTFRFIPVAHGLGKSLVLALQGDRDGNMWIGTTRGLVRYDTRSGALEHFHDKPGDPKELFNDSILSLYLDRTGTLWAGTAGRYLHRYNRGRGDFTRFDFGASDVDGLYCLGEDSRGNIFCAPLFAQQGRIAVGFDRTTGAVVKRITRPDLRINVCLDFAEPMCIDASDGLWVQVRESGKRFVDRTTLHRIPLYGDTGEITLHAPEDQPLDHIWTIVRDRTGAYWAGTDNGAVKLMLDAPAFRTYRNIPGDPTSLSEDRVRGIHMDRYGTLWVGTDNGLNRLDRGNKRWRRYLHSPLKSRVEARNVVNRIFEDTDGTLFIGTNDGMYIYDRVRDSMIAGYAKDRRSFQIWSFCRDSSGILWVGTRVDGVFLYDRNGTQVDSFRFVRDRNDSSPAVNGLIWDMHLDRRGVLWLATSIGLYRWLPGKRTFRRYGIVPADRRGMSEESVCAIMEDPSGVLWFSTHAGGLNRYNRSTDDFTFIRSRDGLPSEALYGTLMDKRGRLWISSNAGLTAYDPATRSCRVYNVDDGLQGNEFSFVAFHKTRDGHMIFGGVHGLSMFNPDTLYVNLEQLPMVVTEFRVFDTIMHRELLDGDTVEIEYNRRFISFEFAMLNYVNPGSIRYQYRMAGLHDDWIHSNERRYVSFTNLDPGTYTFMVKGTNNDGVWSPRPLRIVLKVIPPFWMTWWFKGLAVLGIVMVVGAGTVLRIRSVKAKETLRRRGVESQLQALRLQVNPHFIFNALSSIQYLVLINERERAVDYLSDFSRLVRAVLENSERTAIPLADEIENLRNYLDLEMLRFEGRFHYTITVDPELDLRHISIPTMLLQPCTENAIKHGLLHKQGEGHLTITITGRGDLLYCSIEDDGVGRERAAELRPRNGHHGTSMGLRVTEERLNILNAASAKEKPISMKISDLHDDSGAPSGTRVELFIPIEFV